MKALKILERTFDDKLNKWENKWKVLFGNALSSESNLADLTDKKKAKQNLGIYDEFLTKDQMKNGTLTNVIHHNLLIQDENARLVSDRSISFWNRKINKPISGTSSFFGNSQERFIPITITDPLDTTKDSPLIEPVYVTFEPKYNTYGMLGDTWIRYQHSTNASVRGIYIGNTGSYTGEFTWYVFY